MDTFLSEVARRIMREHPDDMDKVAVIFNNRRPGLFLNKQLMALKDTPFFLPHMLGMDDLVATLSQMQIVSPEFLLFELYKIHRDMFYGSGDNPESFEDFVPLGDMMIGDFSQLDLYCVDAKQLFGNLYDLKEIGEWNLSQEPLSDFQKRYLMFYKSLGSYYERIRQSLRQQNLAYSGMAYRHVAENMDNLIEQLPYSYVYFVGFNALSKSEKVIVKTFIQRRRGTLITDGDAYYVNDVTQEAGYFLRRQHDLLPEKSVYENHFAMGTKRITIVSCPENVMQTKYAGKLLSELVQNGNVSDAAMEQTAVVLADEKLLVPMLNALPDTLQSVNVTMGYPFPYTAVYALSQQLIDLHASCQSGRFYHKCLISVLGHPYIGKLLGRTGLQQIIQSKLAVRNSVYLDWNQIAGLLGELGADASKVEFLFTLDAGSPICFLSLCEQCAQSLYDLDAVCQNVKEQQALACWMEIIRYFREQLAQAEFVDSLRVFQKIYNRIAQRHHIAFYGEPISGLQLLGMLETRNLDFKRVILLGVNEGVLPSGRTPNTLIPFSLKTHFGMPTYREHDAVYANHLYSLLQRADEVYMVYNTDTEGTGKGEPSRFILQVRNELSQRCPNIQIEEVVVSMNDSGCVAAQADGAITDTVLTRLWDIASNKGFSPSALNTYRACPVKYYYDHVLSLVDPKEVDEEVDNAGMGTITHELLCEIYKEGADIAGLTKAKGSLQTRLNELFKKHYSTDVLLIGKNKLMIDIAQRQITDFLDNEIQLLKEGHTIEVIGRELKLEYVMNVEIDGVGHSIKFIGTADRIDRLDGVLRVVDYKTGLVQDDDVVVKADDVPDKWFQIMFYAWLYKRTHDVNESFNACLAVLRSKSNPYKYAEDRRNDGSNAGMLSISNEMFDDFENLVVGIVSGMLSAGTKRFSYPDRKCDACKYCNMSAFCKVE